MSNIPTEALCTLFGYYMYYFLIIAQQPPPPGGQDHLIIEVSRLHSETPQSVGLLWASDQPDAENSDNTQHSQQTDNHVPGGIRTRNPSKREVADPRLRQRGHWDRREYY